MRALLLAPALLVTFLASGCSGSDDAGAQRVADVLADKLADHTLAGVPLTSQVPVKAFGQQVAGLRTYRVAVDAGRVHTDGDKATSDLRWSWRLGDHDWTYTTTARLVKGGNGWQVDWRPAALAPTLSVQERLEVDRTTPERASIVGAGDTPIVTPRKVYRLGLDKARVPAAQVPAAARRIAKAAGVDPARFVEEARSAGARQFVEAIVLRPADARPVFDAGFIHIPGALILSDTRPLAPTRSFGAGLLGQVGAATAEAVKKAEGRVQAGDQVGLSGLQARYDEQLGGTPTIRVRAVTVRCASADSCTDTGQERVLASWTGQAGQPLRLTLDVGLQAKAERILANAGGEHSPASAVVAIRPSTGDLLVAANGPGNDGANAATYGRYAPGSTFKIVSSLALLRAGLKPDDIVTCPPSVVVDGRRFTNYRDYPAARLGKVTYRTAIANSCNTAVIGQRGRVRPGDLADAAAALGLGVDQDLGFPAYFGQVPAPGGATEQAADMIGQGKVLASPMAMATVAASVAAGHVVVPHLLADHAPTAEPRVPLTATEARQLRDLMRAVVTEGSGRFLASLPGAIGAKTGTAEYGTPGPDGSLPTHTWMIATRGDLAVAVFVETGVSGSQTAGPLLKAFLS
ncbi:penicillin-binding transpeptidase domain-containing protein [Nocardioides sp. AN3]